MTRLIPFATIVTLIPPDADLVSDSIGLENGATRTIEHLIALASEFREIGPKWVLLRGGAQIPPTNNILKRKERDMTFSVLVGEGGFTVLENQYLKEIDLRDTDGSLASAIACNIANGMSMIQAVKRANSYVEAGIQSTLDFRRFNPFHSTYILPFAP